MSTNEVKSIQQQVIKQKEAQNTVKKQDSTIDVFASNEVGARVSLMADETNSLFNKTKFGGDSTYRLWN